MRAALVTGCAGFIGSNLCKKIQEVYPNCEITGVDNWTNGADFKNLEGVRLNLISGDLCDKEVFNKLENRYSAVYHMASNSRTTNDSQWCEMDNNVESFRNLLEHFKLSQSSIYFASSASVYGNVTEKVPFKENRPLSPQSIYSFSKVQLENLAEIYRKNRPNWKIVGFRFFNVYGPFEAGKKEMSSIINQLCRGRVDLIENGEQKRDFIHSDVVTKSLIAAHVKDIPSGIYNLGTGKPVSFNQILEIINKYKPLKIIWTKNPYNFFQPWTCAEMDTTYHYLGVDNRDPLVMIEEYIKSLI